MKSKKFRISLLALLVTAATGGWFVFSKHDATVTQNYVTDSDNAEAQSIKGATEYYNSLRADLATGKINREGVYNVYAQLDNVPRAKMGDWLNWTELGPDDIGGRTRGIVIDKDNNSIIYAGGVSGGIWKSTNAGATWRRIGGREVENINVAFIVQAANGDLYYSTGEGGYTGANADGNSGFLGRGIFKSTDRGETFTQLKNTDPNTKGAIWENVHRMAADPNDGNRIYAGNDGGLYITNDGGATWTKANLNSGSFNRGKYIVVSPDGNTVYAAMANNNPGQAYALYRSKNKGETWERIGNKTPLPTAPYVNLKSASSSYVLAMSPSNPQIMYLSSAATDGSLDQVYRTEDGGDSWKIIGKGDTYFNPLANQGQYDHCIVVDPKNEDRIIIGGLNLWEGKSINGQFQFTQLTSWTNDMFGDGSPNPYYVHADQHILVFDNSTNPVLYIGSDGGVSKSVDFTTAKQPTFFNSDYGYNTVQFYGIGVSAYNPREVIGGTQDNGVLLVDERGLTLLNSDKIRGGDGGFSEISKINPNAYFGEYIHGAIFRSFNKGKAWSEFMDLNMPAIGPPRYPFITIFSLWESLDDATSVDSVTFVDNETSYNAGDIIKIKNPSGYFIEHKLTQNLPANTSLTIQDRVQARFYVGAYNGIYFTRQALVSGVTPVWFRLANLPGFVPHDIKHSKDGNTVFVSGSEGITGVVYRIDGLSGKNFKYTNGSFNPADYGITVTKIFSKQGQIATGIGVDENDPAHVLVTLGSYGYNDHIYRSKNAMDAVPTFTNISSNLPDFPLYDALINLKNPNEYLVAGEYGIWSSRNGGATWQEENGGMERVPTFMLRQMKFGDKPWNGPVFYAATHGRGVFYTETLSTGINDNSGKKDVKIDISVFPNPARNYTNVKVELTKATDVRISVIDIQGKVVAAYNYNRQGAGSQNYKIETSALKEGTYFVRVNAQGADKTSKLLILK